MRLMILPALALALTVCAETPVAERIKTDLAYLASPELKGRGNGYPELDKAADYLVGTYRKLGMKAQVQRYAFVKGVERLHGSALLGKGDGQGAPLAWGKDIEAYGFSADAEFRNRALAFVGYGAKTQKHDDLAGIDLNRKVAVILPKLPEGHDFDELDRMERGLSARVKKLQQAGAAAVIVVEETGPARSIRREEGPSRLEIPVLSMTLKALAPYCEGLEDRIAKLKSEGKPQSLDYVFAPWTYLNLELKLKPIEVQLPNVVAEIRGNDPKLRGEYIALGAHFDHLGLGERGSLGGAAAKGQVHPGADDNASGTAMVLELARELRKAPPKRSILLMHFSGEEEGMLGSAAWIKSPTVKLDSVKFMVNFDMVGYLAKDKPNLYLGHIGAPKQALERAKTLAPAGLTVSGEVGEMAGSSDHISFSISKIPTFFFFTSLHANYHRPSDTADKINVEGMVTLTDFARKVAVDLADGTATPVFDPETAKIKSAKGGPWKIEFNVIPDYAENPKGFRIQGVSPGKAADKLGLQAGDILIAFGEFPVKNIYDYMEALGKHKPGDKVVVKWLRGDQQLQAETVLKGRD
jgi:hypothetical protein